MAFLIVGTDESGTHATATYTVVASVLGSVKTWQELAPRWLAVLKKYGLSYSHATEFNCGTGMCESLSQQERVACVKELIGTVSDFDLKYIAYAVEQKVFNSVVKKYPKLHLGVYDYLLSTNIGAIDSEIATEYPPRTLLQIEDGCELSKNLSIELRRAAFEGKLKTVRHISYMNKKKFVPIQVADMIAYESFKYLESTNEDPPIEIRKSFKKIIQGNPFRSYLNDEQGLRRELPQVIAFLKLYKLNSTCLSN